MLDLPSVLKIISDECLKRVDRALDLWERELDSLDAIEEA